MRLLQPSPAPLATASLACSTSRPLLPPPCWLAAHPTDSSQEACHKLPKQNTAMEARPTRKGVQKKTLFGPARHVSPDPLRQQGQHRVVGSDVVLRGGCPRRPRRVQLRQHQAQPLAGGCLQAANLYCRGMGAAQWAQAQAQGSKRESGRGAGTAGEPRRVHVIQVESAPGWPPAAAAHGTSRLGWLLPLCCRPSWVLSTEKAAEPVSAQISC